MFTKKEYIEYFKELQVVEKKMIDYVNELKKMIEYEDMIILLDRILEDENKHILWESSIIDFIDKNY